MLTITINEAMFDGLDGDRLASIVAANAGRIARNVEAARACGMRSADGSLRTESPEQFRCGEWTWKA